MAIESKMRTTIDEETSADLNDSVGRMSPACANRVSTVRRSLTAERLAVRFWHFSAQF